MECYALSKHAIREIKVEFLYKNLTNCIVAMAKKILALSDISTMRKVGQFLQLKKLLKSPLKMRSNLSATK